MSATNPTPGTARSRGVSSGDAVWLGGQLVTFLLTSEETGGRLALVRAMAQRGGEPPCHLHRREDETLCVLAGHLTCYVGGEPRPALMGTCVYLPCGLEHGFVVESDEATLLHLLTPTGYEGAIRELGMVASSNTRTARRCGTAGCRAAGHGRGPVRLRDHRPAARPPTYRAAGFDYAVARSSTLT
jgi:quercetin dioxygenase-like cupin family protein